MLQHVLLIGKNKNGGGPDSEKQVFFAINSFTLLVTEKNLGGLCISRISLAFVWVFYFMYFSVLVIHVFFLPLSCLPPFSYPCIKFRGICLQRFRLVQRLLVFMRFSNAPHFQIRNYLFQLLCRKINQVSAKVFCVVSKRSFSIQEKQD